MPIAARAFPITNSRITHRPYAAARRSDQSKSAIMSSIDQSLECSPRNSSATLGRALCRPLLRPRLPPELLLNRLRHEVLEHDVVRHAVQLQAAVKVFGDARRQLRQDFFGLSHQTFVFFGGGPGPPGRHFPRRFRRRPFLVFVFGLVLGTLPSNDWIAVRTSC